jgi:carotenoid 1,2-hydratase
MWSLRERAIPPSHRTTDGVTMGASTMEWSGDALCIDINERTTPFGGRGSGQALRGRLRLLPAALTGVCLPLEGTRRHHWWPIAPLARVEAEFDEPNLRFRGHGYLDANLGDEPLESAFDTWCWSRARIGDSALLSYDVRTARGASSTLALRADSHGTVEPVPSEPIRLPTTVWGLERHGRAGVAQRGTQPRIKATLEDGPFYGRALVETGRDVVAMHEVLSGERLRRRWVRFLAGFRMGKAA